MILNTDISAKLPLLELPHFYRIQKKDHCLKVLIQVV